MSPSAAEPLGTPRRFEMGGHLPGRLDGTGFWPVRARRRETGRRSCGIRACDLAGRGAALEGCPRGSAAIEGNTWRGGGGWRNAAAGSEPKIAAAAAHRQLLGSRSPSSRSRRPSGAENAPGKSSGGLSGETLRQKEEGRPCGGRLPNAGFSEEKVRHKQPGGALLVRGEGRPRGNKARQEKRGGGGALPFIRRGRANGSFRLPRHSTLAGGLQGKQAGKVRVCSVLITKTRKQQS